MGKPVYSERLTSAIGHVVWSQLVEADKKGQYTLKLAFDKNAPEVKEMQDAVNNLVEQAWPDKTPKGLKNPSRDGNQLTGDNDEPHPLTKDKVVVNFATKQEPGSPKMPLFGMDGASDVDAEQFWTGNEARVQFSIGTYDFKDNDGMTHVGTKCYLDGIQWCGKGLQGEGAPTKAPVEFGAVATGEPTEW